MQSITCHQTATSRTSPQYGCACIGELHQAPLAGVHAPQLVEKRLAEGWTTPACKSCGHHGWLPPMIPVEVVDAVRLVDPQP